LARLEEEARRVDLKTAEYRSKLGEKSALCDRFRAESDSAQQELAEHHRERKQWQLDQQDENLHKAKTVLGQAESRHTQVREQLQGDFARLQDELGASRKDGQQWETMCGEQTAKLEKREADLEHLREENLRITHKATFNIDSSMQEVDALKAERAQLQQELADAQAHTRTRTHTRIHL
jgi:chromosome segregation ATPase